MKKRKNKNWLDRLSLFIYDEIDSTNDEAKRLKKCGIEGDLLIWAYEQYKGKGRGNRYWVSDKGNLYVTFVVKPSKKINKIPQLSFVSAIAVGETLKKFIDPRKIQYKWPNDILIDGKKISGILLESAISSGSKKIDSVIVGIGININNAPQKDIICPATCLAESRANDLPKMNLILDELVENFLFYYDNWNNGNFTEVKNIWLENAYNIGKEIKVATLNQTLYGNFIGLDAEGCLILKKKNNEKVKISSGEIFNI